MPTHPVTQVPRRWKYAESVDVYQFLPSRQSGRDSSYGNTYTETVPLSTYYLKHGAAAVANATKSASLIE